MDKFIRKLVKQHKTNCPFELASKLNITIIYEDLGKGTKGFFYHRLCHSYIVIDNNITYEEQRFTVAHELAHYFFDQGTSFFHLQRNTLQICEKFEHRANRFAVYLLCFGDQIEHGETIREFCLKHNIPEDMHHYYISPKNNLYIS
ncbi:ImmA/IrrE family metallo-endopeptidase [Paenibacillus larvae]